MKMENSFLSPRDGIIKSISVILGDAVDKGQLLLNLSKKNKNKNIEKDFCLDAILPTKIMKKILVANRGEIAIQ
jgi:acetyl/propionyl-CoA carboxylase alpha subunit